MRLFLVSALLSAALAACTGLPPPPNQSYGAPSFDRSTRTLYLNGRDEFYVPESVNTVRLDWATMITVTWEQQGDRRVVIRYAVDEWSDVRP